MAREARSRAPDRRRLFRVAPLLPLIVAVVHVSLVNAQPASATAAASISAGGTHTCALTAVGGAQCWGANDWGQLGDGTTTGRRIPDEVAGLTSGVAALSTGLIHTCALTTAGGVKCWGENFYGQLGDGSTTNSATPVNVSGLSSGVTAVSAGDLSTCALTVGGGVKCWGSNGLGQLGDGSTTGSATPVNVFGLSSGVTAISAGDHACALSVGGGVKCWGDNHYGQLGNGSMTNSTTPVSVSGLASGAAAISAGGNHTCAVTTNGGAKCWGLNQYGQLGNGTKTSSSTPVNVSGLSSGVSSISAGYIHTCALTTSGGAKCWGNDALGELGDGTHAEAHSPVSVSGFSSGGAAISAGRGIAHTCAVTTAGRARCWGDNDSGQLGDGSTLGRASPVQVSGLFPGEVAQADALISKRAGFVGDGRYNTSGFGQTSSQKLKAGTTARYALLIQNDGDAVDSITVDGQRPASGFEIEVTRDGDTVTKRFFAGTLRSNLEPGEQGRLILHITVDRATDSDKVEIQVMRTRSTNDVAGSDAVKARATVIR
jgi:alpha-tubulin suppressor-like RCC1 family protein